MKIHRGRIAQHKHDQLLRECLKQNLNDLIQHDYQEVESNAAAVSNVLTGGFRTPPNMPMLA